MKEIKVNSSLTALLTPVSAHPTRAWRECNQSGPQLAAPHLNTENVDCQPIHALFICWMLIPERTLLAELATNPQTVEAVGPSLQFESVEAVGLQIESIPDLRVYTRQRPLWCGLGCRSRNSRGPISQARSDSEANFRVCGKLPPCPSNIIRNGRTRTTSKEGARRLECARGSRASKSWCHKAIESSSGD